MAGVFQPFTGKQAVQEEGWKFRRPQDLCRGPDGNVGGGGAAEGREALRSGVSPEAEPRVCRERAAPLGLLPHSMNAVPFAESQGQKFSFQR